MNRRQRGRPPWWPEGEAWPPPASEWHNLRRRFVRRAALFVAGALLLVFLIGGLVFRLSYHADHASGWHGPPVFGVVFFLILGAGLLLRLLRGTAAPVGDLLEATTRLAAGDYSARVAERGPRELRQTARAFNVMAERVQANEQQRRDLLADVAHELRTPLSIIRGNAEGLLDGLYQPDQAHLGLIIDEAEVMARLLNDLSTLSRADAGQLTLQREPAQAGELAAGAVSAFESAAQSKGVALGVTTAPALPPINVDRIRLHEVLSNLIGNALNHTPSGGRIEVDVGLDPTGAVRFLVRDNGEGITAEALPHIFERFSKSPQSGGSGLGLAIARSLVHAHGGEIYAESDGPGKGATLSFTIPIQS